MKRSRSRCATIRSAAVALALAISTGAPAASATPQDRERRPEQERELLELGRRIPAEPTAEQERELLSWAAEASGLTVVEIRAPEEPGARLAAELEALGASARVHEVVVEGDELAAVLLPARLRSFARPLLVESLELVPRGEHGARLTARIAFPTLVPFTAGLDRTRALLTRVDRAPRPMAVLLHLAEQLTTLPVGITRVRVGDALEIDAVAGGRHAVSSFESALAGSGLRGVEVRSEPRGGCLALSATAPLDGLAAGLGDESDRDSYPHPILFASSGSLCAGDEATPLLRAVRTGPDSGAVRLRLRGARRGDALALLEMATGHPWIGFGSPEPRLDLDLATADVDATVAALREAGAPLRRFGEVVLWSDAPTEAEPDLPYQGEPMTLTTTCVEIPFLLELFEQVTGLEIVPAPEVGGCLDAFASDRPWDEILDAALTAAGLDHRIEGTVVHVAPAGPEPASAATVRTGRAPFDPRWQPALDRVEAGELRLLGLLRSGEAWRAFAEGPLGQRYELTVGAPLADARVEAVDGHGVVLVRDGAALRLDLP